MTPQASVLVVEDNDLERQITAETLREEGFAVEEAANGRRAMELLQLSRFDVVLSDLMMPGMTGEELLIKVKERYPAAQVVILTAHGSIDSAVKATKEGAFNYLTKPTDRETLVIAGARNLQGGVIMGQDPAIMDIIRIVQKVAPSNSTILIQGESGTGKEVIA